MLAVGAVGGIGRLGLVAAAVRQLFDPRSLFTAGEQGVWYDQSDLSTLFQDSAGTTPVTAVEQPVGLMLDKSGRGNHAFQPTAIDRPILRQDAQGNFYLAANGTNTWMQTNNIDFTATDKVTVFAGVRKLSDAVTGVMCELGASSAANNGTFHFALPNVSGAGDYGFYSRGTSRQSAGTAALFPSPISSVLTGIGDISGDITRLRVNGAQAAISTSDQGTGNFGNYPLYLFRRGGTTLPFNGNFYGLLIRGALTSDPQTIAMERWLAPKTGVTIP